MAPTVTYEQAHAGAQEQRSCETRKGTFLAPLHQTPSCRIALLFATQARDSKVSLLAGYTYGRPFASTIIAPSLNPLSFQVNLNLKTLVDVFFQHRTKGCNVCHLIFTDQGNGSSRITHSNYIKCIGYCIFRFLISSEAI